MSVDHHAEERELHDLFGHTVVEVLRAAADLIESKVADGWGVEVVDVSSAGTARIVFERSLAI